MQDSFPRMMRVRQRFSNSPQLDIRAVIEQGFRSQGIGERVKPGSRIAVAVGSRGIRNLDEIVSCLVELLKAAGSKPFIVPKDRPSFWPPTESPSSGWASRSRLPWR